MWFVGLEKYHRGTGSIDGGIENVKVDELNEGACNIFMINYGTNAKGTNKGGTSC